MDLFQKIVLSIAIFFLIIFLITIAYAMHSKKNSLSYPPVTAGCPDYWIDQANGSCTNVKNLGKTSCARTMNFNTSTFNSSTIGLCAKSQWAKNCNLTWDGVTNNENACSGNIPGAAGSLL